MRSRRGRALWGGLGLGAVLAFVTLQLVLFAVLDRRPPNDHDWFFATPETQRILEFQQAGVAERPGLLVDSLLETEARHPRLAQTWLVAFAGTVGWNRLTLRLSNLPFLWLLVIGVWLAGRQMAGPKMALLAAFLAGSAPVVVNMSRKWFLHFHTAAMAALALGLLFAVLRARRPRWWLWVALGVAQGLRLHLHPIGFPDALLLYGLLIVALASHGRLSRETARGTVIGLALAAAATALVAAPTLLRYASGGAGAYLDTTTSGYFDLQRWQGADGAMLVQACANYFGEIGRAFFAPATIWWLLVPGLLAFPVALILRPDADADAAPDAEPAPDPGADAEPAPAPEAPPAVHRAYLLILAALLAAQIPLGILFKSNDAFVADMLFLVPEVILLSLGSLARVAASLRPGRTERVLVVARGVALGWAAVLVGSGVATVVVPMAQSLNGPNVLWDRAAYPLRLSETEHGFAYKTHHYLVREHAEQQLAELAGRVSDRRIELWDLTWLLPAEAISDCRVPPVPADARWTWESWDTAGTPEQFPESALDWRPPGDGEPRLHLVRLWYLGELDRYCPPSREDFADLAARATPELRSEFGESATVTVIGDPSEWLIPKWAPDGRDPVYAHGALLFEMDPAR